MNSKRLKGLTLTLGLALSALTAACSDATDGDTTSSGGKTSSGGNSAQGGTGNASGGSATGGTATSGGNATGGNTSGGAPASTGGSASGGLSGGATTGGSAGAATTSGGTPNNTAGAAGNPSGGAAGSASGSVAGNPSGGTAGKATGGAAGNPSGGSAGKASGGAGGAGSTSTGGSTTGGVANTGGTGTGGASTGGTSTGGTSTGGVSTGGTSTGGVSTGGVSTGGTSTGGVSTGGTGTGGSGGNTSTGHVYYVTPTGKSTNDGSSFANAMDFPTARGRVVAGDTISLQAGTYPQAYVASAKNTIVFSQQATSAKPIRVLVEGNGRAVFDFSFPEQAWVQDSFGFHVTGNYWYFEGIDIIHAGYQGAYVVGQYNTFENCSFHDNRNTGLEINKGGAYTTVINCDSYRNYDPKKLGSMADGFGPKETQGPGNKFIGCRAWENSDDGYDAYESPQNVTFENCSAFRNGIDVWNIGSTFAGNGNGFKVGGNAAQANHKLTQCIAFSNVVKGFDQNNNTGGLTLYNCTSYKNGTNYGLGGTLNSGQQHVLKNNISLGGTTADAFGSATQSNDSWSSGFSVSDADFVSLDVSLGSAARNPDGTLPTNNFLRLKPGSALIDKGVNVGLPFTGTAPDLGAFETN